VAKERDNQMRRQVISMVLFMMLALLCLAGCLQQQNPAMTPFIGSWHGTYSYGTNISRHVPANITFYANGSYHAVVPLVDDAGTWSVSGSVLTKTMNGGSTVQYSVSFSQNGTRLLLSSQPTNEQWNLTKT